VGWPITLLELIPGWWGMITNVAGVQGHCESAFGRVADAFAAQLESGRDVGGSVGVYLDGDPVVGIWGGSADPARGLPWAEHTITPIGSTSKALASTAVLILVDRGLLDLDEPVARYWPAFGQNGKEDIPVRLVLSHRSGVAALDTPISNDQAAALDPVLRLIEQQRPWWRPGTKHGYHAMTYGFILSGLVRAVTGRTVGQFFADEVAKPLNLDLHIGLPRDRHSTVAPMIGPSQRQAIRSMLNPVWFRYALGVANRRSASYRATFGGTSVSYDDAEELTRYEVEDASAGAVGNGPSLARMFAALIGEVDGRRLISADLMNAARQPQASGRDVVLRVRTDWGLGFALPGGPMWPDIGVPGIFGHTGASGSLGFADAEHRLAFGYTPNLWAELSGWFSTPFRFQALDEAVFECAGVRRWPRVRVSRTA
jgi:CubicO group peptidase (beta-lactamase class C family)